MDSDARTVEHLKLIQGAASRMADNSARMKTWAVSPTAAAFVFAGLSDDAPCLVALGVAIAVAALGAMDARCLHPERCCIALYAAAAAGRTETPFDPDYRPWAKTAGPAWKAALSRSVGPFYGALALATALLAALGWRTCR